jgi:MATE family multidrug resistance protein
MCALAVPVVLAELGWMAMGVVDTIMVGRLGPEAIGAVGLGNSLFMTLSIFGMGLLLGLDTLVSQAFGARRPDECRRWLFHGVALSLLLVVPLTLVVRLAMASLDLWRLDSRVLPLTRSFFGIVSWSLLPLFFYTTFRRYLQATGFVVPVTFALVSANLINLVGDWALIYGHLGAPALGTDGAAWSTLGARIYMALVLFGAVAWRSRRERSGAPSPHWRLEARRLRRLVELGLPAALQLTLEIGVFATATALVGRLHPRALASHQIALQLASITFMVPLGIASAGAVRVGHAVGRRDAEGVWRAGWTALVLGAAFMSAAALAFVLIPRGLLGLFTSDSGVVETGVALLLVAALFQLFDGVQVVGTGILRGLGDTRTAMVSNLVAHWFFGLPIGYALCFALGWGAVGLWIGLSIGLIGVAIVLLRVWLRKVRSIHFAPDLVPEATPEPACEPA